VLHRRKREDAVADSPGPDDEPPHLLDAVRKLDVDGLGREAAVVRARLVAQLAREHTGPTGAPGSALNCVTIGNFSVNTETGFSEKA
jgi:hypothetical protein